MVSSFLKKIIAEKSVPLSGDRVYLFKRAEYSHVILLPLFMDI